MWSSTAAKVAPPLRILAGLAAWFVAVGGAPGDALAAFEVKNTDWDGTSELLALSRARLGAARVRATAVLPWGELTPADGVLLLHPELPLDPGEAAAFLAAGGRLAVVDDHGAGDRLLARFRIRRVRAPLDPAGALRNDPDLPFATRPEAEPGVAPHPLTLGVTQVVANHPTGLRPDPGLQLTQVLELRSRTEAPTAFALVGVIGDARRCGLEDAAAAEPGRACGRLLAVADPSALMNEMLRYPGNRTFATHVVDYLVAEDPWGRRGGTLYLLTGRITATGHYASGGGLAEAVGDRVDALAELVADARRDGLPARAATVLGALALAALAAVVFAMAARRYRPSRPVYARAEPLVGQGGLAGRAAVLAAPTTPPALVVSELRTALEETLAERLGLAVGTPSDLLLSEIDGRGALPRRESEELRRLLDEMKRAEDTLTRPARARLPDATVARMHESVTRLLAALSPGGSARER